MINAEWLSVITTSSKSYKLLKDITFNEELNIKYTTILLVIEGINISLIVLFLT